MMSRLISSVFLAYIFMVSSVAGSNASEQDDFSELLKNKIRVVQHLALNPVIVKAVKRDFSMLAEIQAQAFANENSILEEERNIESEVTEFDDDQIVATDQNVGFESSSNTAIESVQAPDPVDAVVIETDHELILRKFMNQNDSFKEIYLMDNEAQEMAVYPQAGDFLEKSEREQVSLNAAGQVFIGPLTIDEKTQAIINLYIGPNI